MTVVADLVENRIASGDVAPSKYPPHRNVRVEGKRWDAFGAGVGERGRSKWLSDFIDWINLDAQVWIQAAEIARKRGEVLGVVINAALRRYVSRHRDLLDDPDAEDE